MTDSYEDLKREFQKRMEEEKRVLEKVMDLDVNENLVLHPVTEAELYKRVIKR